MNIVRQIVLFSTIILFLLCTGALAGPFVNSNTSGNQQAPDFTLKNINGQDFSLKANRGRPLLLVFTTTWCSACKREIPELKKISEKIDVIAIYINEPMHKMEKFIQRYNIPYTVLVDPMAGVAQDYNVVGVPTKVLISSEGKVLINQCMPIKSIIKKVSAESNMPALF